jgi:hypothetical protein
MRVLLLQDKVLGEELGLLAADAASSRYSELSESHLFPITEAPSSLLPFFKHRVVFRIFAVNGPHALPCATISDLTHLAGFALFNVPLAFQQNN